MTTKILDRTIDVLKKKTVSIISEEEIVQKLKKKSSLNIKYGVDPSARDIHLGHTVPIMKLKELQDLGHQIVFIIGDFTAQIGDPTGKSETRKLLSKEAVLANAKTYQEQIFKILDKEKTKVVFNSSWFGKMNFSDVVSLASKYTVARMLERDDFLKRYKEGKAISILEFFYPLIQGYDSVIVESDIEIGGTDQTFNLLVGRDLQREFGQEPQGVVTLPILEGTDGTQKMSKSLNNHIGITEPAKDVYGKIMSISDSLMLRYYELLTNVSPKDIEKIKDKPLDSKKELGRLIVTRYYDEAAAATAQQEFSKVFSKNELPTDIEEYLLESSELKESKIWIVKLLTLSGLVSSSSEARRMIKQGGIKINDAKKTDMNEEISVTQEMIVQVGKRKFKKIIL
ncbi:tyrosine--tRNA ligase [Candidatus Auribacterota bacterium]